MNLDEWKQLCHEPCEKENDYLQIERFAEIGGGRYFIRNIKKTVITCTPETKSF